VVKVLYYKSEGRWFDPSWCQWIFHWHNPFDRTMALESTQPLTEMSTRSISRGKGGRCVRLTTLPPSCAVVTKSGNLNFLEPSGPLRACNGTALLFTLISLWHFILEQDTKAQTGAEAQFYSFFNFCFRWGLGGQRHTSAALASGKRPGTHCIRGGIVSRVGLDGCEKSRSYWISSPGPISL